MRWLILLVIVAAAVPLRAQQPLFADTDQAESVGQAPPTPAAPLTTAETMAVATDGSESQPPTRDESDGDDLPSYNPVVLPSPAEPKFLADAAAEEPLHENTAQQQPSSAQASAPSSTERDEEEEEQLKAFSNFHDADKDIAHAPVDAEESNSEEAEEIVQPKKSGFSLPRLAGAVTASVSSSGAAAAASGPQTVKGRLRSINGTLYVSIDKKLYPTPLDIALKLNDTTVTFDMGANTTVTVTNGFQAKFSDGRNVLVIHGTKFPLVKGTPGVQVNKTKDGVSVTINGTLYVVDRLNNFILSVAGQRTLVVNGTVLNETVVPSKPVSSWVPTFLTPSPELSLSSSLYVWIPNNMTNALDVKYYQIRHLLGRVKELQVEIARLSSQFVDSEKLMDDQLTKQIIMQRNFHHLHRQHDKATRGPTIDDRKQSLVTQLPLLEEARRILSQQSKQLALIAAWKHGSKLNIDMRVAFQRNIIRLQRQIGILALETVALPLSS